jgi:hypothetical protein
MHGMQQMDSVMPDPARLKLSSQQVIVHDMTPLQTHIILDRWKDGVELLPGQKREVEMVVDEIASLPGSVVLVVVAPNLNLTTEHAANQHRARGPEFHA